VHHEVDAVALTGRSAIIAGLVSLLGNPEAEARQSIGSERLVFTFSGPVAIPGTTLPPGKYLFTEVNSTGSQALVKVTNDEGTKLFAMTFTLPVRRMDPKGNVVVTFAETSTGVAPAIRAWFAPGALTGHQFVYPDNQAKAIADATKTLLLSADRDDLTANELRESLISVTDEHGQHYAYKKGEWDELPRVVSGDAPATPKPN
jgi:hypothetical protein